MTQPNNRAATVATRLPSLTGMRFIAALMVCSLHFTVFLFAQPDPTVWAITFQLAATGVSYFFILSGFILTWSAPTGDTPAKFWRRRFFKVYPNHLVTFVAAMVVLTLVVGQSIGGWSWLPNLLLVHSYSPDIYVRAGFNQVAWSLSCEATFYLLFPLLLRLVNRIRVNRLWVSAAALVALIAAMPGIAALTAAPNEPFLQDGVTLWSFYLVYQFPPVRMLEFVFGMVLARLVLTAQWRRTGLGLAGLATLAGFALTMAVAPTYRIVAVMVVPLGMLIVAGTLSDTGQRRNWLASAPMGWLGEISFSFFMWHVLVLECGYYWLIAGTGLGTAAILAIGAGLVAVVVVVAWLQYSLVERPIMRRFSRPRRAAAAVTLPSTASDDRTDTADSPRSSAA